MENRLRRRAILRTGLGASLLGIAGCSSTTRSTSKESDTASTPSTILETTTTSPTNDQPASENQARIHVDASRGSDDTSGAEDDPLGSIQEGINRANPGQNVVVAPGQYRINRPITTVRHGEIDAPITISGPPGAIVRPLASVDRFHALFHIKHDHIRLRGLTLDGLGDPNRANKPSQYKVRAVIRVLPPTDTKQYLRDIVVKPHAVGNSYWGTINLKRAIDVEVGEFKVIGLAGAGYVKTGTQNKHAGEIVYVGTPPSAILQNVVPLWGIDQSRNIHIHHIDNSAGHAHSELVNTKLGTHNVLIEYCTDGGGSQHSEPYPVASINLQSYNATVRWCKLRNGNGHGIHVNSGAEGALEKIEDPPLSRETAGTGHRIFGNDIKGFSADAIAYTLTTPKEQDIVCGNIVFGSTQGTPTKACPTSFPDGDGIGHLGGDSPWA